MGCDQQVKREYVSLTLIYNLVRSKTMTIFAFVKTHSLSLPPIGIDGFDDVTLHFSSNQMLSRIEPVPNISDPFEFRTECCILAIWRLS